MNGLCDDLGNEVETQKVSEVLLFCEYTYKAAYSKDTAGRLLVQRKLKQTVLSFICLINENPEEERFQMVLFQPRKVLLIALFDLI